MKSIIFIMLYCFIVINFSVYPINKIVYLISPPRSLSTAFLRMMDSRKDFEIMLEPAFSKFNKLSALEFKKIILEKAEHNNLFIKELSFGVKNFLINNDTLDLVKNSQVFFLFLMRNPHHAIISRYNRHITTPNELKVESFTKKAGYEDFYEIFNYVKQYATNKPAIILSENLYTDTEKICKEVCNFLKIPYFPESLVWEALGSDFTGELWNNVKPVNGMNLSHGVVLRSTGFHQPTRYKLDLQGLPTFEEVSICYRHICKFAYEKNLIFYKKMLEEESYFLKK